jgi:tRNA1(Val) A37 N6-methylase TrmN6
LPERGDETEPGPGIETPAVSRDALLGGRVTVLQPVTGYRAAIDPVFLAAAVSATAGERVLDVGAGVGTAALCLAARVPGIKVSGIEVQRDLVRLAMRNADINGLSGSADFMRGSLLEPPLRLAPGSFHHVMANPPFVEAGRGNQPPDPGKAAANVEGAAGIGDWLRFCLLMARSKGSVTLIHRADRLDDVLAAMRGHLGEIVVFPLWPGGGGKPAKRVIVRGRKGLVTPMRLTPGLILHETDGAFTAAAEAVLRDAGGLTL